MVVPLKNSEGQVARWLERLQDFKIEHRVGRINLNAEVFSRGSFQQTVSIVSSRREMYPGLANYRCRYRLVFRCSKERERDKFSAC